MDTTALVSLMHALGLDVYVPVALAVIGVAASLAAILPHPAPGSPWVIPRKLLDLAAMNTGSAKNATPTTPVA